MKHKKLVLYTIIFAILILTAIIFTYSSDNNTNKMITEYIENIGWKINKKPNKISHYKIPDNFDQVFNAYNELQKKSGYNLEDYKNKSITAYSYIIKNHKYSTKTVVQITILTYKSKIIGGEISSRANPLFIHEITDTSYLNFE